MPNYQKGLLALAILIVLACLLFFMPIGYVAKDGSNIPLQVELSKATTYITEPLDKYGRPDYLAAVGRRKAPPGVTPQNNAWAGVIEAVGWCPNWFDGVCSTTFEDGKEVLSEESLWRYKQLGLRPPRPDGGGLISLEDYVKANPEKFKRLDIGAIWRDYLKANEGKSENEKKDVEMIPEWLIRVAVYDKGYGKAALLDQENREEVLSDPEGHIFNSFTAYDDEYVKRTDIEQLYSVLYFGLLEGAWSRKLFPELGEWFDANRPRYEMMSQALERPRFYLPFGDEKYAGIFSPSEGVFDSEFAADDLAFSGSFDIDEATPDDHLLAGRPKLVDTSIMMSPIAFARLFACYAYDAAAQNNFDQALRNLQAIEKLSNFLIDQKNPSFVEMLVAAMVNAMANEIAMQLVGGYELTAEQIAAFEKWLATARTHIPIENSFLLERLSALEVYITMSDYLAIASRRSLYAWLKNGRIDWDEAMRIVNEDFDLATEAFEERSEEKLERLEKQRLQRRASTDSWTIPKMIRHTHEFNCDGVFRVTPKMQRRNQLLGLALALRQNQRTTGDLPENLKDGLSQEEQATLKKLSEDENEYVDYQKTSDTTFQLRFATRDEI